MRHDLIGKALVGLLVLSIDGAPAWGQQRFSCSFGDRGACLGYGDTVCSSLGKCVSNSAVCFDSYQCDYEGFTCKSNVTDLAREYDDLVERCNELLEDARRLERKHKDLVTDFNDLLDLQEETRLALISARESLDESEDERERQSAKIGEMVYCINQAATVPDARLCVP